MSVVNRVYRPNHTVPVTAPRGPRGRRVVAAALGTAAAVLSGTAACGVQTTGVHISAAGPITLDVSTPSASASGASAGSYQFYIFLWHGTSVGNVTPVLRTADHELSAPEIVDALGTVNEDEAADGLTTQVPFHLGEQLLPTKEKHAYQSLQPLTGAALTQLVCTLDLYWVEHPDPDPRIVASTKVSGMGIYPNWDDCSFQPGFNEALSMLKLDSEARLAGPLAAAGTPNAPEATAATTP